MFRIFGRVILKCRSSIYQLFVTMLYALHFFQISLLYWIKYLANVCLDSPLLLGYYFLLNLTLTLFASLLLKFWFRTDYILFIGFLLMMLKNFSYVCSSWSINSVLRTEGVKISMEL